MELLVDHSLRLAFAPIPKAATTSIKKAMGGIDSDDLRDIHFGLPVLPRAMARKKGYFIFTFVRNPFDRIVSIWADRLAYRLPGETRLALRRTGFEAGMNFSAFVERLTEIGLDVDPHLKRQVDFLFNDAGHLMVDFIGRFERLEQDWMRVQSMFPSLPPLSIMNRSNHKSFQDYYSKRTRKSVKRLYGEDLRRLGYAF